MSSVPPPLSLVGSGEAEKSRRVLACVLCQQRKVKCNRKFPCVNCIKSNAQCVPATLTPRRRKRQPPGLLERLTHYESLLRQHNIPFEQTRNDSTASLREDRNTLDEELRRSGLSRTLWQTPSGFGNPSLIQDSVTEDAMKHAWDSLRAHETGFFFTPEREAINLAAVRPDAALTFRLWQIYLDNVNPLLMVTHTPTLQSRIVVAASGPENLDPILDALMFSIYCIAVSTLDMDECRDIFGPQSSKSQVLATYQSACRQTLIRCNFLWSDHREALTAFFLYLLSIQSVTNPRTLSSILGIATRIAQRMGIHCESSLFKLKPFEAEMCRRLWWALILFDTRIGEMANDKNATQSLQWDCNVPLDINDSDLWENMTSGFIPAQRKTNSDSMFAAARSGWADVVRRSGFHVDSTTIVALKRPKEIHSAGEELIELEKMIEDIHLRSDPSNRLHFMTIWMGRKYLARCCLLSHMHQQSSSSSVDLDTAISHALSMLYCDTKISSSPLTKGFHWLNNMYMPLLAYVHISQGLRRRPFSAISEEAWKAMSANFEARNPIFEARFEQAPSATGPFFKVFASIVLQTWEVRAVAARHANKEVDTPGIVTGVKNMLERIEAESVGRETLGTGSKGGVTTAGSFPLEPPSEAGAYNPPFFSHWDDYNWTHGVEFSLDNPQYYGSNQLDWGAMNW